MPINFACITYHPGKDKKGSKQKTLVKVQD